MCFRSDWRFEKLHAKPLGTDYLRDCGYEQNITNSNAPSPPFSVGKPISGFWFSILKASMYNFGHARTIILSSSGYRELIGTVTLQTDSSPCPKHKRMSWYSFGFDFISKCCCDFITGDFFIRDWLAYEHHSSHQSWCCETRDTDAWTIIHISDSMAIWNARVFRFWMHDRRPSSVDNPLKPTVGRNSTVSFLFSFPFSEGLNFNRPRVN